MNILFLGTASGVPTKSRNVTGIAVGLSNSKRWFLVDCGEATQHQLLRTSLSLQNLAAIFITHVHGDHCYGLPGLLASAGMNGRTAPLTIYAPKGIKEWLSSVIEHTQLRLPYQLAFVSIENKCTAEYENVTIAPVELSHRVPSYGYVFNCTTVENSLNVAKLEQNEIPRGPIWGKLQSGKNVDYQGAILTSEDYVIPSQHESKLIVCGDNDTPEKLSAVINSCDVLVHESTYTEDIGLGKSKAYGHSYAKQVAEFAEKHGVKNLVLTHFSSRYQNDITRTPSIADIEAEARKFYSGALFLASDFDRYALNRGGMLSKEVKAC